MTRFAWRPGGGGASLGVVAEPGLRIKAARSSLAVACLLLAATGCEPLPFDAHGGAGGGAGTGGSGGNGGDGAPPEPSPCGETPDAPAFEIGMGEVCFQPLPDDGVVPRIYGFQGGFHVWLAVLCADCPSDVIANVGVKHPGGDWVYEPGQVVLELRSQQAAGLFGMMGDSTGDPGAVPAEGAALTAHVSLTALDGTPLHEGSRDIVLGETETWVNKCDPDPATCGQPTALPCCDG